MAAHAVDSAAETKSVSYSSFAIRVDSVAAIQLWKRLLATLLFVHVPQSIEKPSNSVAGRLYNVAIKPES